MTEHRREYQRLFRQRRRADDRQQGARRIDVTLKGDMLEHHALVRRYIETLDKWIDQHSLEIPPRRRSITDTEIVREALKIAADSINTMEAEATRDGRPAILKDD